MLWFIFTAIAILLFLIVKFSEKALNFVVPTICISAILMVSMWSNIISWSKIYRLKK